MSEIPALPPGEDFEAPKLARLLAGGDRSSSALTVFVQRASLFSLQPLDLNQHRLWGIFHERLRNLGELVTPVTVGARISNEGIALNEGLIVNLDIEIFSSFFDAPEGNVQMPEIDDEPRGNHSVVPMGVDFEHEDLRFTHIFSSEWGESGNGVLSWEYIARHAVGASVTRWHGGPAPEIEPADNGTDSDGGAKGQPIEVDDEEAEIARRQRLTYLIDGYKPDREESTWLLQHEDDDLIWMGRKLIGAGSGDVWFQGATLLRGMLDKPILVGWMSGRLVADDLLDIEECFVWPTYRGRGIGTALVGRTLLYAAALGVRQIRWIELETDAIVNERLGGGLPRWASNFEWRTAEEEDGWGASRVAGEIEAMELLERLANLHVPGGVHLAWSEGVISIADHHVNPEFGVFVRDGVMEPEEPAADSAG